MLDMLRWLRARNPDIRDFAAEVAGFIADDAVRLSDVLAAMGIPEL
jgi:hypothetical protein